MAVNLRRKKQILDYQLYSVLQPNMHRQMYGSYQCLNKNLGIAGNTNAAIALADGDWIAFMDHDDLLAPDALFELVKMIRQGFHNEDGLAATIYQKPAVTMK